jgi:pimeloyl-ACP methyl ester carboxylesterase
MPSDRPHDSAPSLRRLALAGPGAPVEIAFTDWPGPDDMPPLICIPGFTRTGRDFEELAKALAGRRRVICPDLVGRGESSRLADPAGYTMRAYLDHISALASALRLGPVAVLGVSMGGLVAMGLASEPALDVRDLIVVDVGPSVPSTAFDLLDLYLAGNHRFTDFDALLAHVKRFFAACNLPTELAWRLFAFRGARKLADGSYVPDYDPAIRVPFRADFRGMERAWPAYDAIAARTLVLRGAQSHVLPADVAEEMHRRGPCATLVTIPATGHWPALIKPAETAIVARFLAGEAVG